MRAAVATRWGGPEVVEVREVPDPVPGPEDVVVRVRAAALNHPDLLFIANRYQVSVPAPFVPGSEFSGDVLSVGSAVTSVRPGDEVMGAVATGAFAEQVVVPASAIKPRPAGFDWHDAAAFHVTYLTAYHALVSFGSARPGQRVVVLGAAGGVGSAVVDVAVRMGLSVIGVTSGAERARFVLDRGARAVIDHRAEPLRQRLREVVPEGVDVVVDPVGGDCSEAALRAMAWGGRFVVVGFAAGEIPRIPLNLVLLKGVQIRGLELRTLAKHDPRLAAEGERQLTRLAEGGLRPSIGAVHRLDDIGAALRDAAAGRIVGKTVIDMT